MSGHIGRLVPVLLIVALSAGASAQAATPQDVYYEAYYHEVELGDFAGAAKLYENVTSSRKVDAELKARAEARLAACREEVASTNLASLMPPDVLFYVELNSPGAHLNRLLDALGLLAAEQPSMGDRGRRIAISPLLFKELLGIRGAAVAVTGIDPQRHEPTGVAVFNPGDIDVLRAAIESALPAATSTVDPIGQFAVYSIEDEVLVCVTHRLVLIGRDREQLVDVLDRLQGNKNQSLAGDETFNRVLSGRDDNVLFVYANARRIMPLLAAGAGNDADFQQARALLDLDSLQWAALRLGVNDDGVYFDVALAMDEGHHNLAYNLVRTPPVTKATLDSIPRGAAAFLAGALADPDMRMQRVSGSDDQTVTGLDIGREIFANIVDFAVFVLPAADNDSGQGPPAAAAVIRVTDASKSEALWTQILGIVSLAAGAPSTDGTTVQVGGMETKTYQFPEGVEIYFASADDKVVIATSQYAIERAAGAGGTGQSILDDPAFRAALARMDEHTSKAVFVHPGRCFEVGKPFMDVGERREAEPYVNALLSDLVVSVFTHESNERVQLSACAQGLPDLSEFLTQLIEMKERSSKFRREMHQAIEEQRWDDALAAIDAWLETKPQDSDILEEKFRVLATGKGDRTAALACARVYAERSSEDATALNNFAWRLLTEDEYDHHYDALALELAERACALTDHTAWAFVDTLALAKFQAGEVDAAIQLEKRALELYGREHEDMARALERYKKAAATAQADVN